jgi:ribosomal protein L36
LVTGKPWRDAAQDFFSLRTGNPKIVIGCKFVKRELRVYVYFDYARAKEAYVVARERQAEVDGLESV